MDEAGRTTQSPLIMAPPSLNADPDGGAEDTIVDNGIMSPSRKRTGSSRSGAPQRAEDADGDSSSDGAATVAPAATADEDTAEAGSSTPVPLPAETVGQGKVRSTGLPGSAEGNGRGSERQERQGSRQAMTSADSTWLADKTTTEPADAAAPAAPAASGTQAAKSDRKPSFSPSAGSASAVSAAAASAATTSTPAVPASPASSAAEAGSSYSRPGSYSGSSYTATSYAPPSSYSRSDWSTSEDSASPASAPAAPARADGAGNASSPGDGYSPRKGSSSGAGPAVTGAAAGLASSVNSAWQKQRDSARNVQARKSTKRQAMLTLARVEPWSVMKFSFVASVVAFIILFVAVAVLYMVLSALGVFDSLQHTVSSITSSQSDSGTNISHWFSASLILGYTAMLGALNIVLITAMSTVGSVIYNLIAKTIGGIEVTLRETD